MPTLITGATGHLGAHLVRALLARGERVRVLVRPGSVLRSLDGLAVEYARGDLGDPASLAAALAGCDRAYHLAALISIQSRDRQHLWEVNVLGTRALLAAAARVGVERVVHCSSLGAVGRNPAGSSGERWIVNPFDGCMPYDLTKTLAEQEALKAVLRGLHVVIVNPSGILGAWDWKPSLLGATLLDVARGKLWAYIPGGVDLVPATAVADGILRAMERGKAGERYILSGELVTLDQLIAWVIELTGARHPRLRVPRRLVQPYVRLKDRLERHLLPRRSPRYNLQTLKILTRPKGGDATKAIRDLGYQPGSVRAALAEAIAWYREVGYLNGS